jgi:hypothetical protein
MTPVVLDCGHVEYRPGKCATTDCRNYVGVQKAMWASTVAIAGLLLWVRVVTGRGAISIILDTLPALPGMS